MIIEGTYRTYSDVGNIDSDCEVDIDSGEIVHIEYNEEFENIDFSVLYQTVLFNYENKNYEERVEEIDGDYFILNIKTLIFKDKLDNSLNNKKHNSKIKL